MTTDNTNNKYIRLVKKYFILVVGIFIMAFAVNLIFEPFGLVTGGVSGLAIVIKHLTGPLIEGGVPIWLSNILLNVPLFLLAYWIKGKKYILNTLAGTIIFTIALYIIPVYDLQLEDKLLGALFGGALTGIGIGLIFAVSSSTGGTDLLAVLIQEKKRHLSAPQILNLIDGAIIVAGAMVFGISNALYAIIAVLITTKVSDGILEGLKFAKMAFIISDEYEKIAKAILVTLDRGVTGIYAKGMYSNKEKKMLFCVVSKKQIVEIIEIAKKTDPDSFVIVSDVREVVGEGFIEYRQ
ncbi:MAG: YitT family protein [Clostridiales bacterium]|nr:YitT family protein [Clostridiales bacterium]